MGDADVVRLLQAGYSNLSWYEENLDSIKQEFDNRFIAISQCSVVASAKSVEEMMRELKKKNINASDVLIEHVSKIKSILHEAAH
jgi:hypothetical protein